MEQMRHKEQQLVVDQKNKEMKIEEEIEKYRERVIAGERAIKQL